MQDIGPPASQRARQAHFAAQLQTWSFSRQAQTGLQRHGLQLHLSAISILLWLLEACQ
jgi:hypothetical protein